MCMIKFLLNMLDVRKYFREPALSLKLLGSDRFVIDFAGWTYSWESRSRTPAALRSVKHVNTTQPVQINQDNWSWARIWLADSQEYSFEFICGRKRNFAPRARHRSRCCHEIEIVLEIVCREMTLRLPLYISKLARSAITRLAGWMFQARGIYSQPIGNWPRMFRESWSLPDSLRGSVLACKLRGLTVVSNRNVLLAVCKLAWTLRG